MMGVILEKHIESLSLKEQRRIKSKGATTEVTEIICCLKKKERQPGLSEVMVVADARELTWSQRMCGGVWKAVCACVRELVHKAAGVGVCVAVGCKLYFPCARKRLRPRGDWLYLVRDAGVSRCYPLFSIH